jgi:hypothetical protein
MNIHERLKLLSVFHYVIAGIMVLFGCFPLIHVTAGLMMLTGRMGGGPNPPPPEWFGLIFVGMGAAMSVFFWALAGAAAASGYFLRAQRHWTFCLVVAGLECMNMPLGTILGVFTIITLVDPQAKAMFERPHSVAENAPQ